MKSSMRVDRTQAARVTRLLASLEDAGVEVSELQAAAKTEATLASWLEATVTAQHAARTGDLVELTAGALVAAATKGENRPAAFVAAIEAAEARQRTLAIEAQVLTNAHDLAAMAVVGLVDEDIIATLQPAYAEVLDAVRKLAPALAGVDPDSAEAVLAATTKTQQARSSLVTLRRRYETIRTAWSLVVDEATTASDFALLRDPERAWGSSWRGRRRLPAPWPTTPLAFMLWLSKTDAEPWLPTSSEVAAREAEEREKAKGERKGASFVSM